MKKQNFLKKKSLYTSAIMIILLLISIRNVVSQNIVITVTAMPNGYEEHKLCLTQYDTATVWMPSWGIPGNGSWEKGIIQVPADSLVVTTSNQGLWSYNSGGNSCHILIKFYDPPTDPWTTPTTTNCGQLNAQPGAPTGTTYLWSTGEITQTINTTQLGNYTVTVTSPSPGCGSISDAIEIIWAGIPPSIPLSGDFCAGIDTLLVWVDGTFVTSSWNTGDIGNQITVANSGTYIATVTNAQGCQDTASTNFNFNVVPIIQPCYFSFDPPSQHNQATWVVENPPITDSIRYMIKDTSGLFVPIAVVGYNDGVALDTTTFPQSQYYEYCLQSKKNSIDCGWSSFSEIHRTIMLSVTQFGVDVTLSWWQYIAPGITINNYSIWAIDNTNTHHAIATIPALTGLNGYIFSNAPANYIKYYVTFNLPCSAKGTVQSPIITPTVYTGIDELQINNVIIYPNPCTNTINIEMEYYDFQVEVTSMLGQVVLHENNVKTFNISSLPQGVYIINIIVDGRKIPKRFIKQ